MTQKIVQVSDFNLANNLPLTIIAGPCVIESLNHAIEVSGQLTEITKSVGCNLIYKTSFDKANRTSQLSPRGVGIDKALKIFESIKKQIKCPILTDVHSADQCEVLKKSKTIDVLQIPAFLCRQTDLLVAAGNTGLTINIKKGQFLAPWDMENVAKKVELTGNNKIMLCERGASFGYNTLVSDMRSIPILAKTGWPVVFDATHSVQQPGGKGTSSNGQREFAPVLARAAAAVGVAAIFLETHESPDTAPSDGPNMIPLNEIKSVIETLLEFDHIAKNHPISI